MQKLGDRNFFKDSKATASFVKSLIIRRIESGLPGLLSATKSRRPKHEIKACINRATKVLGAGLAL